MNGLIHLLSDCSFIMDFTREWMILKNELEVVNFAKDKYLEWKLTGQILAMIVENVHLRKDGNDTNHGIII